MDALKANSQEVEEELKKKLADCEQQIQSQIININTLKESLSSVDKSEVADDKPGQIELLQTEIEARIKEIEDLKASH